MAQQPNTVLIQQMYDAFNSGDIQTLLANAAPNAECIDYGPPSVPYFGNFTGRITDFFKAIGESTSEGHVAVEQFVESGDTVVALGRYTARVRDNGVRIDEPIVHVFTVRDGKVTSWKGFGDSAAVAAAHSSKGAAA